MEPTRSARGSFVIVRPRQLCQLPQTLCPTPVFESVLRQALIALLWQPRLE